MEPTLEELEREFGPLTPSERAAVRKLPKGSAYGWPQLLGTAHSDGTAVTATTVGSLLPPHAVTTLPANLMREGNVFKIQAAGRISNIVTSPGTLTLDVRLGSVTAWASGAFNLNVVLKTNVAWWFDLLMTVRSIGNATIATLMGQGQFTSESVVGSAANTAGGAGAMNLPVSAPAVGTGFDSTVSQALDFRATFGTTGNSIQLHQYTLWHLTAQ